MEKKDLIIQGSGGGKSGGGARSPIEAENTLQSRSTAKIIHVLSEGEIVGLVGSPDNPLQSVFFDQTPVVDSSGNPSFNGVSMDSRNGTPFQEPLSGFPAQEDFFIVATTVEDAAPVVRSIPSNTDAARVIVRLPNGLTRLEDNGDLNGYVVGVAVDIRAGESGAWTEVFRKYITGKTTSPYEEAYRIERPTTPGVWQVRVRRTTATDPSVRINDELQFWAVVGIKDSEIAFENAAVVGLAIDSEATGGNIPVQSFLIDGMKLLVPDVYFPTQYNPDGSVASHPTYSGIWDGFTFKESFCDDPAWIVYNLIVNERWGLGISPDQIDQYSFYEASLYNVELIEAYQGSSEMEPRFTFNGTINTREDPYKVIQAVAATCRAVVYANPGLIKLIQDRPSSPVNNINNTNVVDGLFVYSSTPLENRITSVNVTFNDINDRYLPRVINEQASQADIARYGFNQLSIGTLGVVRESHARRLAKWALDTALNTNEIVTFSVGWENAFLDVGDVFYLADNDYANIQYSGKIKHISDDRLKITLDRPYTLNGTEAGIDIIAPTGVTITKDIDFAGSSTGSQTLIIRVIDELPPEVEVGHEYFIRGAIARRQFKVISVSEGNGDGILEIQAALYDPTKYDRVESGIVIDQPPNSLIDAGIVEPPYGLTFDVESVIKPDDTIRFRLRISWSSHDDPYFSHYLVRWRRNNGQYSLSDRLTQAQFIIDDTLPGLYDVLVNSVNTRNVMSTPATGSIVLDLDGQPSPLGAISGLELAEGGTEFNGPAYTAVWQPPPESSNAVLKDYVVRLYDENDNLMKIFITPVESQTVTKDDVIVSSGLQYAIRNIKTSVAARDTLNRISDDEVFETFTNPAPEAVTITSIEPLIGSYKVNHTESTAIDFDGYVINHSTDSEFVPSASNKVKEDVGLSHIVEAEENTTYYVRVGVYDTWSRNVDDLNYSAPVSVTTDFTIDVPPPPTPDTPVNLIAASNITTLQNGTQVANIQITWNRITGDDIVYDLEIKEDGVLYATPVISNPTSGSVVSFQLNGVIGAQYCFRVRARRAGTVVSDWTTPQCVTQAADTTAAGVPSGLTTTPTYQGALVKWTNPTSSNFSHTEVWRRQGSSGSGVKVGEVTRPISFLFDNGLNIGSTYQYRVRSVTFEGVKSIYTSWVSVIPSNVPDASIVASSIAANSITANAIQANAITADKVGANEIITTSANIGDAVITSAKFADTIQSDNFVSGVSGWRIKRNTGSAEFGDLTARGSIKTGVSPALRTEITADDPTYVIWIGSGTKNDSNGIFWVKTNGTSFISDQVFDLGSSNPVSALSFGSSNSGTGGGSTNGLIATSDVVNVTSGSVKIDVNFQFVATKSTVQTPQNFCTGGDISGTMALLRRVAPYGSWSTIKTATIFGGGRVEWYPDSDPSLSPGVCTTFNRTDVLKTFVDNPSPNQYNYRVLFSSWSAPFTTSQISTNKITATIIT